MDNVGRKVRTPAGYIGTITYFDGLQTYAVWFGKTGFSYLTKDEFEFVQE